VGGSEGRFFTPPSSKKLPRVKTSLNERSQPQKAQTFATPRVASFRQSGPAGARKSRAAPLLLDDRGARDGG